MKRLQGKLSYANVMATIAVFIALGGSAYAATQLKKNSVGTKQLKKNSVTGAKVKDQSLTGKDINLSELGTVPSAINAAHAAVADSANAIAPAEATHVVGAAGEPVFLEGSANGGGPPGLNLPLAGFYRDHEGIVHLEGVVKIGSEGRIFTLPPGDRPPSGITDGFEVGSNTVFILGGNVNPGGFAEGTVAGPGGGSVVLSGITFRAGS